MIFVIDVGHKKPAFCKARAPIIYKYGQVTITSNFTVDIILLLNDAFMVLIIAIASWVGCNQCRSTHYHKERIPCN